MTKTCCVYLVASAFVALILSHGVTAAHAQAIPSDVKSIVAYIFIPLPGGQAGAFAPNGTGFFVGVRHPDAAKDVAFIYLVTARHVITKGDGTLYSDIGLRLNKKVGKSELVYLPLAESGDTRNVFFHPDKTVDLAVIATAPDMKVYDYKWIPMDGITSHQDVIDLKIAEGSEVFFTGLFAHHIGDDKNHPIVRFGRMALLTDERIRWGNDARIQTYLIESPSYGGNSGSPVFFFLGPERDGGFTLGGRILRLAGIIQGTFNDVQPIVSIDTASALVSRASIGISAVVPAYKLRDVLLGQELKKQRGF